MLKVRCLYRVSSKQQLHGDDIPLQRNECKAFINKQPDWVFDKEYIEKGISGFKKSISDRDILVEIAEDASKKEFDILLVYMSDRLGRREGETPLYVSNLSNMGIEVWSVKEGKIKTEEHIDKLLNYIRFWQAEGESRKTGMRVKDAQVDKIKRGEFVGGYAPFGYDLVPTGEVNEKGRIIRKLVINEEKAEIVRKIYDYAANYGYGAFKITKVLNEQKIPAIKSGEWKRCTITDILKNPIYMGYLAYGRRTYHGNHDRLQRLNPEDWIYAEKQNPDFVIVSPEVWRKVQEMREGRKANIKQARDKGYGPYPVSTSGMLLLMGLMYCGYCGKRLTNGSKYDYWTTKDGEKKQKIVGRYKCNNKANASLKCEGRACYRQEEIEPIVLSAVKIYLESLGQLDVYSDILEMQEKQRKDIKNQIASQQKKIKTLQKDIETMEDKIPLAIRGEFAIDIERLSDLIKGKEQELQERKNELEEMQIEYERTNVGKEDLKQYSELVTNWSEMFDNAPIPVKKVLLSKIIERIDVYKDDIKIKFRVGLDDILPVKTTDSDSQKSIDFKGNSSVKTIGSDKIQCIHGLT